MAPRAHDVALPASLSNLRMIRSLVVTLVFMLPSVAPLILRL